MIRPFRLVFWILGLAAAAVGLALAARYSQGYVVIILPAHRVDLSLNLAVIFLCAGFIAFYMLIRIIVTALEIPDKVRIYRAEKVRAEAQNAIAESLTALFSGRFDMAEKSARRAMEYPETKDVAATIAAWAAFEAGNAAGAIPYLENITGENAARMRDASLAYVQLAEGKTSEALPILRRLHDLDAKNPGVLKMKLEAELAEKAWEDVIETLPKLVKSGLLPESAAGQIRLNAELNLIKNKSSDRDALLFTWKDLPSASRYDPAVTSAVARALITLGCGADAQDVVEQTLDREWDAGLARIYGDCKGDSTLAQIERAEKWLRAHARDASLLLALGKLCMRQDLWGKAQSYLEASVALHPSLDAHMTLANLMERLGKPAEAVRHIRRSAELAG